MSINNSQNAQMGIELSASMIGSATLIGSLIHNPDIIIFDNQGGASVTISPDGVNIWRTFPAGEALTLDLRVAQGKAPYYSFPIGTSFFGNGASGTFSISYIYTKEQQ